MNWVLGYMRCAAGLSAFFLVICPGGFFVEALPCSPYFRVPKSSLQTGDVWVVTGRHHNIRMKSKSPLLHAIRPNKQTHVRSKRSDVEARDPLTVAVIGGGIAGLSCAQHLAFGGKCVPTVFDTGRIRPGGRCSSRQPNDPPPSYNNMEVDSSSIRSKATPLRSHTIDHAVQIITVTDQSSPFAQQVHVWEEQGILKRFPPGSVCEILSHPDKHFDIHELNGNINAGTKGREESVDKEHFMYYGVKGMGSIALAIADAGAFQIEQDVWVSPSNGVKYIGTNLQMAKDEKIMHKPRWRVKAKGQVLGEFDRLVIAHNGKCADRLMSKTPARKLHSLLRVNFSPTVPKWGGKRMTLNSIYSLCFAVKSATSPLSSVLREEVYGVFIKNEPTLRFLSSNTRKLGGAGSDVEIWTLLSSSKFAKKYKAPQENLPKDIIEKVTNLMLKGLEASLGLEVDCLQGAVLESKLQLWGAAVPLNTWAKSPGYVYDGEWGVGACGDWLLHPSVEGAWESGRLLARWITKECESKADVQSSSSFSVGLPPFGGEFRASKSAMERGIGSFELGQKSPVAKR